MTDEPHLVAKAMAVDEADQLLSIRIASGSIAGKDDDSIVKSTLRIEPCRRGDQVAVPFDAGEARRVQHDLGAGQNAPGSLQPFDRLWIDGERIE